MCAGAPQPSSPHAHKGVTPVHELVKPHSPTNEIVIVSAADERYAMPLAVTIRSALDRLSVGQRVRLFVLDGGITDESKDKLAETWSRPTLNLSWLTTDTDLVADLPVSDQVSSVTYLRLMLCDLLPGDISKVIYLDADMLVRKDLTQLWLEPMADHAVLAVQDCAAPYIDAAKALANFSLCQHHLAAVHPVANYRELGIADDQMYFNAGLMVIDVQEWRNANLSSGFFRCLREHSGHVLWWDQYALNVVLANKWRNIDPRWNQGAHIFSYPNWRQCPFEREVFVALKSDPWIVHFCSPSKPWDYLCSHPYTHEFRAYLKHTAWRDFRPQCPDRVLKLWWKDRTRRAKKALRAQFGTLRAHRAA